MHHTDNMTKRWLYFPPVIMVDLLIFRENTLIYAEPNGFPLQWVELGGFLGPIWLSDSAQYCHVHDASQENMHWGKTV